MNDAKFVLFILASLLSLTGCNWLARVSVDSNGMAGNQGSFRPSMSSDGRYVAFESLSGNWIAGDTTGTSDIFLKDIREGSLTRVSVDSNGNQADGGSFFATLSADGRYVSFSSFARNLVPGINDTDSFSDVFVHDRDSGTTEVISISPSDTLGNGDSANPRISANGRFIAFWSEADNLILGDTNGFKDVFVYDRLTGTITLVSVDSTGSQGDDDSIRPSISADGRYVAFQSQADNLVENGASSSTHVFVHDLYTGETSRVSVDDNGNEADRSSLIPTISADGRFVAFHSQATNLVDGDSNDKEDVFVHDRISATTTRVSVSSSLQEGNNDSSHASMSADGRYVAFFSEAADLIANDTNGEIDVFVHDRITGQTTRQSVNFNGLETNGESFFPTLSGDGRYVAFDSLGANLIEGDLNGVSDIFIRALSQISVNEVIPDFLPIGATTSVTVTGTNFLPGSMALVTGAAVTVSNQVIVDENIITLDVTVDSAALSGAQTLVVYLNGTGPGPITGAAGFCEDCVTLQ